VAGVYWLVQGKVMKIWTFTAAVLLAAATASADVRVTIQDGLVTVVATDATARQILAEWARVGQATVINGDRVPGGPISLELTNVPEAQVLDTLLRSAAGYLAAPRAEIRSDLSRFDRIVVMPTSSAPRTAVTSTPPAFQQPQFAQPALVDDDPEDERPATPNGAQPTPNPRGPVFNAFPPPQVVNPQSGAPATAMPQGGQMPLVQPAGQQQAAPQPSPYPTNPFGGVAVPGMVVPAPQQPGQQPGQISAPPQTGQTRRPGGNER
jgi:hypothetical protein